VCVGAVAFRLRDRSEVDQTLCWTYPQANQLTPYICRAVTSPFLPCFDPVRQFFVTEPMMGNCVEGEARELQVPTAALHCPKCKGYARLASMVLDVRRAMRVRLYQCDECGELIWDEPE